MNRNKEPNFDVVIIGGGFYGCMLALHFKKHFDKVLLIEKADDLLTKASYNNQARVHNGYHYPRSFITALRSHINFKKFTSDFKESIDDNFLMTYAIAKNNSKVTSQQFKKLCKQIGAPLSEPSPKVRKLFNEALIEEIFTVDEVVFNAKKVREILQERLHTAKVKIIYNEEVIKIKGSDAGILHLQLKSGQIITSRSIYNCTYSQINTILRNSKLPLIPFKHELTEMPLVQMPNSLKKFGITIMDGPFFSFLPFPDKKLHTLHHVRYTPHVSWTGVYEPDKKLQRKSNFTFMIKDAQRYLPLLKEVRQTDSLFEVKTILASNEGNDRRPILYLKNYGIKNLNIIMGGKIDNVYDVINEINK